MQEEVCVRWWCGGRGGRGEGGRTCAEQPLVVMPQPPSDAQASVVADCSVRPGVLPLSAATVATAASHSSKETTRSVPQSEAPVAAR